MDTEKEKLFKDPVHGYISVPVSFCDCLIDHRIFQRLRNVEQTSMRPLYPAAHHDRFIHSLGVYHLGKMAFEHLVRGTSGDLLPPDRVNGLRTTFEIACLLHDCGHAPFSHTYEGFYNHSDADGKKRRADEFLLAQTNDVFRADFKALDAPPAPHESFSAGLLLSKFADAFTAAEWDPVLAARMITGCVHDSPKDDYDRVENRIISLLNGEAIDVDKLDYIVRDTWASGIQNISIDLERLLSALLLRRYGDDIMLCYRKSAMSVLQSVVDARNYLFEWVYNHHTVLYYADLLDRALRKLAKELAADGNPDHFWDSVFSLQPFENPIALKDNHHIFLPTDGDIMYLLKERAQSQDYPEVTELLSHKPARFALWKTYAEFARIFDQAKVKPKDRPKIRNKAPEVLAEVAGDGVIPDDIIAIKALSKQAVIDKEVIQIDIRGEPVSYTDLFDRRPDVAKRFFYVFVPNSLRKRREEFISSLCRLHP